ncbi:MAG: hypothetical protein AB1716_05830 [Planctomycetota bacterium]
MLKAKRLLYVLAIGLVIPAGCCIPIPKLPLCNDCLFEAIQTLTDVLSLVEGQAI